MPAHVSCKELIEMFHKIGGTLVCTYDTRECTLLPQEADTSLLRSEASPPPKSRSDFKVGIDVGIDVVDSLPNATVLRTSALGSNISCKIMPNHKTVIGSLLTDFVYSGSYQQCVTTFPESKQSNKCPHVQEPIHDYQEKGVGGFAIELVVDDDGRWNTPSSPKIKK